MVSRAVVRPCSKPEFTPLASSPWPTSVAIEL
jgi:hypothetical protein